MNRTLTRLFLLLAAALICVSAVSYAADAGKDPYFSGKRDPFWPVGFQPDGLKPPPPPPKAQRKLTADELRDLALQQQALLKRQLDLKGSIKRGGKRYILIGAELVGTGDVLEVQVGGEKYKLRIKSLTSDNILLEPLTE